jgi:phage repressor protein C with HTH and peptisase S24 domain
MCPTLSIDTDLVKRLLIYQMLKVRDNIWMNMYQHRRDRLLALIDAEYGGQRVRFCDRTDISESRLAQLLSATYRDGTAFTEKTARKLEEAAGLPPLYFDQGAVPAEVADPLAGLSPGRLMRVRVAEDDDPALVQIPKVKLKLAAGVSGFGIEPEYYDGSTTTVPRGWLARKGLDKDKLIAFYVTGDSMETTFSDGDLVIVDTADTRPVSGDIYAINFEGEPVIKRLVKDFGRWWLVSDNADQRKYHKVSLQDDTSKIIGKVVRAERMQF